MSSVEQNAGRLLGVLWSVLFWGLYCTIRQESEIAEGDEEAPGVQNPHQHLTNKGADSSQVKLVAAEVRGKRTILTTCLKTRETVQHNSIAR